MIQYEYVACTLFFARKYFIKSVCHKSCVISQAHQSGLSPCYMRIEIFNSIWTGSIGVVDYNKQTIVKFYAFKLYIQL